MDAGQTENFNIFVHFIVGAPIVEECGLVKKKKSEKQANPIDYFHIDGSFIKLPGQI